MLINLTICLQITFNGLKRNQILPLSGKADNVTQSGINLILTSDKITGCYFEDEGTTQKELLAIYYKHNYLTLLSLDPVAAYSYTQPTPYHNHVLNELQKLANELPKKWESFIFQAMSSYTFYNNLENDSLMLQNANGVLFWKDDNPIFFQNGQLKTYYDSNPQTFIWDGSNRLSGGDVNFDVFNNTLKYQIIDFFIAKGWVYDNNADTLKKITGRKRRRSLRHR
jgi:hypothetical protein